MIIGRSRYVGSAAALAALLLLPACSEGGVPRPSTPPAGQSLSGADASRSQAAELEAGVTSLLVERVHLTAATRAANEDSRSDLVAALDASSASLAELLGVAYAGSRDPLLRALRSVDRRALQHADAVRSGDIDRVAAALAGARTAEAELAVVVGRVAPRLPSGQVVERLQGDLTAQLDVRGPDPYAQLGEAALRAPDTAHLLTAGIVADRDLGPSGSRAAQLRAALTGLLTSHVLLAGAVAHEQAAGGPFQSAANALRANGDQLSALLGSAYPALPLQFGPSWRAHVDRVIVLARSTVGAQATAERRFVLAYPTELGALLARTIGGLPATTVADEIEPMLTALVRLVDAEGRGEADVAELMRRTSASVPSVAALLAAAIAQDRRYT